MSTTMRFGFRQIATRQEVVNGDSANLQTKETEAVVMPLPVSMHTGQIIMLTKMLTGTNLRFYDFDSGVPIETWHSGPPSSS